jgi:type VI secretion system protein ImpC
MHAPKLQQLEGTWRGLHHLVMNTETSAMLRLRVIDCSKRELFKDLDRAVEFDQSQAFKKLYENEFGTPGGEPYGALIGDYEFTNHPEDIDLLSKMSNVAAAAFCPFITSASPQLFGFESFTELSKPRDLEKIFDTVEYAKWKAFRESEDSRFVTLTMPRVLARLPYGSMTTPVDEFDYEEGELDARGKPKPMAHEHYCWMNAAYVLGTRLTDAFAKYGFCVAIRGAEGGGKVEGLPAHVFISDDGDPDLKCPTEIGITDRREAEMSKLGFLPLCHYKNTDYAVFFGAQTAQKPKKYDRPEATANAAISARLPYLMATSRFAHYLKVIGRDKIGSFMEVEDCQKWLERWIANYISADPKPSEDVKARYPLREAKIEVREVPGQPGTYNAIAWLRPWLQLEELTTSMRLVARIPQLSK